MQLDREDSEWTHAWGGLKTARGDVVALNDGETWLYMSTERDPDGVVRRHCRHRGRPAGGSVGRVACSGEFAKRAEVVAMRADLLEDIPF